MDSILDLEVHAVPLAVDGRVRGSYTIYKDISEQIRASEAERKHAEVLSQLVTELQLRTQQMTSVERDGRLARVSAEPPRKPAAVVAQSVQKLLPDARFRNPVPVQVVAEPGGGGDPVGRRRRSPRRFSLPTPAGACAAVSLTGTSWRGGINCAHLAQSHKPQMPVRAHGWTRRHAGSSASRVCRRMPRSRPSRLLRACSDRINGWPPRSPDRSRFLWPACGCARPCVTSPFAIR